MPKTLITHNARFHTDDIFACATLLSIYSDAKVIRTRDMEVIKTGDIVFDVGSIFDPATNRFDHHQKEGAGERVNGIPYASFGLIWKYFGKQLVSSDKVWEKIEKKLAEPVDTLDAMAGGMDLCSPKSPLVHPYFIQFAMSSFMPTWKESEDLIDDRFMEAVAIAQKILQREIKIAEDDAEAEKYVRDAYDKTEDKKILILDSKYPWGDVVREFPEVVFVISPNVPHDSWKVNTIRDHEYSWVARKDLPKTWGGLSDDALADVTGVPDSVFCHRGLFLVVARSKEGAIALANKALEA